jgi:hypothetical protein
MKNVFEIHYVCDKMQLLCHIIQVSFLICDPNLCDNAVMVKLSLCLTDWVLRHENIQGGSCIDSRILELGSRWRWVVSFMAQLHYPLPPPGKELQVAIG